MMTKVSQHDNLRLFMEQKKSVSTEELNEGLRYFKQSDKLQKKIISIKKSLQSSRGKQLTQSQYDTIKKIVDEVLKAIPEYKKVEDDFADKKISRSEAMTRMKELNHKYRFTYEMIRKESTLKTLAFLGMTAAAAGGLILLLKGGSLAFMGFSVISRVGGKLIASIKELFSGVNSDSNPQDLTGEQQVEVPNQ